MSLFRLVSTRGEERCAIRGANKTTYVLLRLLQIMWGITMISHSMDKSNASASVYNGYYWELNFVESFVNRYCPATCFIELALVVSSSSPALSLASLTSLPRDLNRRSSESHQQAPSVERPGSLKSLQYPLLPLLFTFARTCGARIVLRLPEGGRICCCCCCCCACRACCCLARAMSSSEAPGTPDGATYRLGSIKAGIGCN